MELRWRSSGRSELVEWACAGGGAPAAAVGGNRAAISATSARRLPRDMTILNCGFGRGVGVVVGSKLLFRAAARCCGAACEDRAAAGEFDLASAWEREEQLDPMMLAVERASKKTKKLRVNAQLSCVLLDNREERLRKIYGSTKRCRRCRGKNPMS